MARSRLVVVVNFCATRAAISGDLQAASNRISFSSTLKETSCASVRGERMWEPSGSPLKLLNASPGAEIHTGEPGTKTAVLCFGGVILDAPTSSPDTAI